MTDYSKIFEKIYQEKDTSTNISLFLGSLFALVPYVLTHDFFLSLILFISIFSLSKTISLLIIHKIHQSATTKTILNSYSKNELETINFFIKNGKIKISDTGLDSLVARNIIEFIDRSMGDGPTGFQLQESVYKNFLNKHFSGLQNG